MTVNDFSKKFCEDQAFVLLGRYYKMPEIETRVIPGRKYDKVDIKFYSQWSGRYMVDREGNIFGIRRYGSVNKCKQYGTLETINDWFWGEYYPIKKGK
jgi:hypothetical protein